MKNKSYGLRLSYAIFICRIVMSLGLFGLISAKTAFAVGILQSAPTQGYPVIGLAGGISNNNNFGRAQTFPIIDPITDEFYIYSPQKRSQTPGLFEVLVGGEKAFFSRWLLQGGLVYSQAGSYKTNGTYIQGADLESSDQFAYRFNATTRQLLAQGKFMYPWRGAYPYLLVGLGASFNTASNFLTTGPNSCLTVTRNYSDRTLTAFAYRLGLGLDVDIASNVRLGLAYRYSGLGKVSLGGATINNINVSGTLSQSNLYANEAVIQVTFIPWK